MCYLRLESWLAEEPHVELPVPGRETRWWWRQGRGGSGGSGGGRSRSRRPAPERLPAPAGATAWTGGAEARYLGPMALRASSALCSLLLAATLVGCADQPPDGVLAVTLASEADGAPVAGALVAVEEGGIFVSAYEYGARAGVEPTDEEVVGPVPGAFTISLPKGLKGMHILADGFYVLSTQLFIDPEGLEYQKLDLRMKPLPEGTARPSLGTPTFSPASAAPGEALQLSVAVTGAADDPISDQVLVVQPEQRLAEALSPPADAQGPVDGTWTVALKAPTTRGAYTYYVVAASKDAVAAAPQAITLVVD